MKICHYLPSLNLNDGGPPRSVSFICKELALLKVDVTIATAQKDLSNDIDLFHSVKRVNLESKIEISDFFKNANFDIIHLHGIWLLPTHYINNLVKDSCIPMIISPRGMLEKWAVNHKRIKKFIAWHFFQKRDLKNASAFHATADLECRSIRNKGFSQPIYCIPNGTYSNVNSSLKKPIESNKKVLFLSRINKKKGLDYLLEAWSKVEKSDWILQIACNDDDGTIEYIKSRLKKPDLSGNVELLGSLNEEEKKMAYSQAGLFVLPSHSENFGIVVAEALSYGIPVITTKGCPWGDLCKFDCGWWIDLKVDTLASALGTYINHTSDDRKRVLSKNAVNLFNAKYRWEKIAKSFTEMYQEVIKAEH